MKTEAEDGLNTLDPHTKYMYLNGHHSQMSDNFPKWNTHRKAPKPIPAFFLSQSQSQKDSTKENETAPKNVNDKNDNVNKIINSESDSDEEAPAPPPAKKVCSTKSLSDIFKDNSEDGDGVQVEVGDNNNNSDDEQHEVEPEESVKVSEKINEEQAELMRKIKE